MNATSWSWENPSCPAWSNAPVAKQQSREGFSCNRSRQSWLLKRFPRMFIASTTAELRNMFSPIFLLSVVTGHKASPANELNSNSLKVWIFPTIMSMASTNTKIYISLGADFHWFVYGASLQIGHESIGMFPSPPSRLQLTSIHLRRNATFTQQFLLTHQCPMKTPENRTQVRVSK